MNVIKKQKTGPLLLCFIFNIFMLQTVSAHYCGPEEIDVEVGETVEWFIEADVTEISTLYVPSFIDDEYFDLDPNVDFEAFHGLFFITGKKKGVDYLSVEWFNNIGPGGSGVCDVIINITSSFSTANIANSGSDREPVNTFTGELYENFRPDLNLGGPMPLMFSRYYASGMKDDGRRGSLGDNWLHSFEWSLSIIANRASVTTNLGRKIIFTQEGTVWSLVGKTDIPYQLASNGQQHTLYEPGSDYLYTFNSNGRLIDIKDGHGASHTLSYNGSALSQVSDNLGRVLTLSYGAGKLTSVSDGERTVSFAYTGNDLVTVTDANGNPTSHSYDPGGLLTAITRPEGNMRYSQTFDPDGRVVSQTDADGNTHGFSFNDGAAVKAKSGARGSAKVQASDDHETTLTNPLGSVRKHIHNVQGELTGTQDEDGEILTLGYDADGKRDQLIDRLGDVSSFIYDEQSGKRSSVNNADGSMTNFEYIPRSVNGLTVYDLTRQTWPDGTSTSYVYDGVGNLTSRTDQANAEWTFTYDANGQQLTALNPVGGTTTFSYNADATLASRADSLGNTTTYSYDSLKRLTGTTHPDGSSRGSSYDNMDNLLTRTDERGHTTAFTYDRNNNLTTVTNALGNTSTFSYDGMDRVVTTTDPHDNSASQTYDELERLKSVTDKNGNTTSYGYDLHGRLVTVTDARGERWSRTYDAESIIKSSTDPLLNTTTYESDTMGRITESVSPLNDTAVTTYDNMGRIKTANSPLGEITTRSYNTRGLVSSIALADGSSTSYTRNALDLITAATDPSGNKWRRTFDIHGRPRVLTDPLGNQVKNFYDKRNRLFRVNLAIGTLDLGYDPFSNITRRKFSDGTDLKYTYDALNRMTSANGISLSYDANNQIIKSNGITITRDAGERIASIRLAPGKTVIYRYDADDNLTRVVDWTGNKTEFTYDAGGRLFSTTRPNGVTTTTTYDNDSQVTGITEGSLSSILLSRDAQGQVTNATRNVPATLIALIPDTTQQTHDAASQMMMYDHDVLGRVTAGSGRTYNWDLASRLSSYTETGSAVSFNYDANGQIVSRSGAGVTRTMVSNYALGLVSVSVIRQGGVDQRYFIYTPGGRLLYTLQAANNLRRDYHFDEMGNTLFLTNAGGKVIASYVYSPFGELLSSSGNVTNPFTWQGQFGVMQEGESGLYYMRARYYDAVSGRFLSRDPIEGISPRNINPYQYASNNPMRYIDPLAEDPIVWETSNINKHPRFAVLQNKIESLATESQNRRSKFKDLEQQAEKDAMDKNCPHAKFLLIKVKMLETETIEVLRRKYSQISAEAWNLPYHPYDKGRVSKTAIFVNRRALKDAMILDIEAMARSIDNIRTWVEIACAKSNTPPVKPPSKREGKSKTDPENISNHSTSVDIGRGVDATDREGSL